MGATQHSTVPSKEDKQASANLHEPTRSSDQRCSTLPLSRTRWRSLEVVHCAAAASTGIVANIDNLNGCVQEVQAAALAASRTRRHQDWH